MLLEWIFLHKAREGFPEHELEDDDSALVFRLRMNFFAHLMQSPAIFARLSMGYVLHVFFAGVFYDLCAFEWCILRTCGSCCDGSDASARKAHRLFCV